MSKQNDTHNNVVVYQAKSGAIELRGDIAHETVWATQAQIASIFDVTPQNVTMHVRNIYREEELKEQATCKESLQVQQEANRTVRRNVKLYNLDVIIAVGYRVNSVIGTHFRQWATKTLREHITKGYTLNRKRIAQNYDAFMDAVAGVQQLLPEGATYNPNDVLELVKTFASTWVSLDAYDRDALVAQGSSRKRVKLTGAELSSALGTLKDSLVQKGEASELFGNERSAGVIEGIVGNVIQSLGGTPVYPTIEEKAAHLLYFMVKNHPFTDGNKRSGAFAFVWFLNKTKSRGVERINPAALTALTLLIAESEPREKEKTLALVVTLLRGTA